MHTAQAGNPDPIAHFKNDTPQHTRSSSDVTGAVPAKRVTFFKSGDNQFSGVRMAIHKRSFKSFDALLDDLSQRVPLPFGVRTITTPRGIHSISHLEQLEDGGCYLCSDRRHVKPINVEAAGKRPTIWRHSHLHNTRRKPSRPEEAPTAHSSHRYPRYPKRIVLVKNNDPAVRRSIILNRRTARSLRVFMEEISELMQCHIRKLYTLEGRKIDSIQSLMQCPNVLVCVGREPFHPLQVESIRNGSDEKLPGLASRSRSSVCSEGHDSKKNVNFGLETKKSIIHPRSDSSNRSTRFSLSSEKSYANGLNVTPGNTGCFGTCPHAMENLMNDDIEKRVLVNKDGSLSVEMKVRFRLLNDETLQWSTEIKKSIGTVNDNSLGKEDTRYLQHVKSESVSDPEFNVPCDTDEAFKTKHQPRHFEGTHHHCCCNHCHKYDIWKNPLHGDSGAVRNIHSSSSSTSSQKSVCKKTSVDSMHTMSQSSEEYTEHVVQKATCYQQTVEGGDTRVEYCTISRCCSHSEVCASSAKCGSRASTEEKCESPENVETRSNSVASLVSRCSQKDQVSVKITQVSEERPVSAISNSSKILEALKEDEDDDDDDDDLPPSVSRASLWSQSDNPEDCECARSVASYCSATTHKSVSSINHLCPRPPSKTSVRSTLSAKLKHNSKSASPTPEVPADQGEGVGTKSAEKTHGAVSTVSNDSSRSRNYYKPQDGVLDNVSVISGNLKEEAEENDSRAASTLSQSSKASRLSNQFSDNESLTAKLGSVNSLLPPGQDTGKANVQDAEERVTDSENSRSPRKPNVCPHCGGSDRVTRPRSGESQNPRLAKSDKSKCNTLILQLEEEADKKVDSPMSASPDSLKSENVNGQDDGDVEENRKEVVPSAITNTSTLSEKSYTSENVNEPNEKQEERSASALSAKSNASTQSKKSSKSENKNSENEQEVVETEQRTPSAMSSKTNISAKSSKSNCNASMRGMSPKSDRSDGLTDKKVDGEEDDIEKRASSAMSARTNTSSKSQRSKKCNVSEKANTPVSVASDNICKEETETIPEEMAERAFSAMSARTSASTKSRMSKKSDCGSSQKELNTKVTEERVSSAMSHSSITSERSKTSNKSECTAVPVSSVSEAPTSQENAPAVDDGEERATSNLSVSTKTSRKSKLSKDNVCSTSERASTPGTPLPPKICGGDDHTETEKSEGRVSSSLSVNSKASGRSRKSHKSTNQAAERVKSPASDRSTQSLKTRKNGKDECSPSDSAPIPASATNGADERIASATTQSTKSKSVCSNRSVLTTPNSLTPEPAGGKAMEQCAEDTDESPKSILPFIFKTSEQSENSDWHSSKQATTPFSNASEMISDNEAEVASVKSDCPKKSKKSKNCRESPSRGLQSTSTGFSDSEEQGISKSDTVIKKVKALESDNKKPSSNHSKSPSEYSKTKTTAGDAISFSTSRPGSSASAQSTLGRSKARDTNTDVEGRPKSNASRVSSSLQVRGEEVSSESEDGHEGTVNTAMKSFKKGAGVKEQWPNSAATSDISQNVLNPSPPKETPKKNKRPVAQLGNSHDSDLSHSLSAADLLRERLNKVKPEIGECKRNISNETRNVVLDTHKAVSDEKSDSGTKCRHRKSSSSSWHRREDEEVLEIVPSSLPNTSPTEVVHEWLKTIPADSPMYEMGEDFHEHSDGGEIKEDVPEKVEEPFQEESVKLADEVVEPDTPNEEENEYKEGQKEKPCFEQPAETKQPTAEKQTKCPSRDALPKSCQSSVQVMKVLLSPKFDRCNSLPEVSPVYGRKLSTSAKGLLDCLANLQLIDSDPSSVTSRDARYNELMNILQSLWLCDPSESDQSNKFKPHRSVEDPKSSSGVDVSSGSAGSGKSSDNGGVHQTKKIELAQTTVTVLADQGVEHLFQDETEQHEDKENCSSSSSPKLILNVEEHAVLSDSATPDIASRVQGSPWSEEIGNEEEKQKGEEGPDSNETVRSDGSLKEISETPSSSNKSSGNGSNTLKSPDETETDLQEDASSGTHQAEEKIKLTRKASQDPDPVWVLNLLKKLEKQFMTHYVNAMTEFKMRWDLDDSEMLDTMINELRDEVRKRIQSSINRELQKIRSRAGKEPRPPVKGLSRESTVQTEQRRRRLKVMRNKSIKESLQRSDDNYTATGTDFSDQRSEDEYCPCDACMKKKMASRLLERKALVTAAPVMMDFDLRKILQMKKDPATTPKLETTMDVKPTTAEIEGDQDKNEALKVPEEEAEDEGNAKEKDSPVAPNDENSEAEKQAEREAGDDQNTEFEKLELDYAADAIVEDASTEQLEGNQECFSEKVEDTAGEDVEETAGLVKESEALNVVEEGESSTENEVSSSEEIPEESTHDTEAVRKDDAEEIEETEAIQENGEDNGAEINDAVVDDDAPEAEEAAEEVMEESADNDNDQSDKDELAGVSEAASEIECDQIADNNTVEAGIVTEDGEITEEAEGDIAETTEGGGYTAGNNERPDKDNADGKEKAEESDSAGQDENLGDEIAEEVCSEDAKSLEGSNVEEEIEKENGKPHEEETTINPSSEPSLEEHQDGSDKAEGEGEQDDVEEITAVTENDTDTAAEEDASKGELDEDNDTLKEQETENSDKDVREDVKEHAAETNVEDSDSSGVEKQHESDVSGDSIEATELDKQGVITPMSTAGTTEDNSEICGIEALTTEKDQIGSDELQQIEDEEWKNKPVKQITKSSIESQPGSMETALNQERKLKDTESPDEVSVSAKQEEEIDSRSLAPKANKHNILSKKKPSTKIIKSRRHKDNGLK